MWQSTKLEWSLVSRDPHTLSSICFRISEKVGNLPGVFWLASPWRLMKLTRLLIFQEKRTVLKSLKRLQALWSFVITFRGSNFLLGKVTQTTFQATFLGQVKAFTEPTSALPSSDVQVAKFSCASLEMDSPDLPTCVSQERRALPPDGGIEQA